MAFKIHRNTKKINRKKSAYSSAEKKAFKAGMAKRKYTATEIAAYYQKRLHNKNVTENQRIYSKSWLDGYADAYAKKNYLAVCGEIKRVKGKVPRSRMADYYGYKNGLKAKLNKK